MSNIYKQFLINNIQLSNSKLMPKDVSNLINEFVFYDKIQSNQRKHAVRLISNLTYNKQTVHMPWYYDNVLNIFVGSSVMVFTSIRCIYNINKFDVSMCLVFCELCGNYMECENMDPDEIPLRIKCNC
jgi:glycerol-3-phosphate O-acyltransferase